MRGRRKCVVCSHGLKLCPREARGLGLATLHTPIWPRGAREPSEGASRVLLATEGVSSICLLTGEHLGNPTEAEVGT